MLMLLYLRKFKSSICDVTDDVITVEILCEKLRKSHSYGLGFHLFYEGKEILKHVSNREFFKLSHYIPELSYSSKNYLISNTKKKFCCKNGNSLFYPVGCDYIFYASKYNPFDSELPVPYFIVIAKYRTQQNILS